MAEQAISSPIANGKSFSSEIPVAVERMPDGTTPAVTSLQLAEHFGIKHRHVLRDIRAIMSKIPSEWHESNFGLMHKTIATHNNAGRESPYYLLTRDGFTLLAMGYNTARAIAWKLRYIAAFNALEAKVLQSASRAAFLDGAAKQREMITRGKKHRRNMAKAAEYRAKGLSYTEIAKLLDVHVRRAWNLVHDAELLGVGGVACE